MTTRTPTLQIADCGDAALRVTVAAADGDAAWRTVHRLAARLGEHGTASGVTGSIATYDALLVEFDPGATVHAGVRSLLTELARGLDRPDLGVREPQLFTIPVVYGGEHGPDLERVAEHQGSTVADVIARHSAGPLTMRCFGSPGGAPMLDGPDFDRPVPRLPRARPHVPAGSVAVAGRQAVVSARPAPGGWCVIGRTPKTLVDLDDPRLAAFRPGDRFRFFAIAASDWEDHTGHLEATT